MSPPPPPDDRTDPKAIEAAYEAKQATSFIETIRNAVLSATFTVCGALAVWVWQIDRTVSVSVETDKQFVTRTEMIEFVAAQRETAKKVEFLYCFVLAEKLGEAACR